MAGLHSRLYRLVAVLLTIPTAFFTWYGVRMVHFAITFDGEGSLGHVGMYVAAYLFPLLALLFGGMTILAWKNARRLVTTDRPADAG